MPETIKWSVTFDAVLGPRVAEAGELAATDLPLNGPVVLIGTGAVALLAAAPQTLRFSNPAADPVDIEILVGRQA